jgi:hypothetical protein
MKNIIVFVLTIVTLSLSAENTHTVFSTADVEKLLVK